MRISDWSSDVCSSDLLRRTPARGLPIAPALGSGRLALADPDAVPAGKYAKAALTHLGVWRGVAAKVAPAENVRAAMALVARGAAPLGIVYATDARESTAVRVVGCLPAASHPPLRSPVALLKASRHTDAETGRAGWRERGCESGEICVVVGS